MSNAELPANEREFFALAFLAALAAISRNNDPSLFCYQRYPFFIVDALLLELKNMG